MTFPHLITVKSAETNKLSSFENCKVNWNRQKQPFLLWSLTIKWTETNRYDLSSFENCYANWNKQNTILLNMFHFSSPENWKGEWNKQNMTCKYTNIFVCLHICCTHCSILMTHFLVSSLMSHPQIAEELKHTLF